MCDIEFSSFGEVDLEDLMLVLNEDSLRAHLIHHSYFDISSVQAWVDKKVTIDALRGCRVRVVHIDGALAGWCGIQPDDCGFEIAIVLSQSFWGYGMSVFKTLMLWAGELGHREVLLHLLDTRREYKALVKMAARVEQTKRLGRNFTTYYFPV